MENVAAERNDWLERRAGAVGASEVAAVMELSHWDSPYSLWAKKTGQTRDDDKQPEWQEWGNRIEPLICEKYAEETGRKVIDHGRFAIRYSQTCPHLSATLDREVLAFDERGPGCMDAKNVNAFKASEWEGGAPLIYQVQLQAQMEVTGYRWGSLAVLLGGNTFRWIDVERNEAFIAVMRRKVAEFWRLVETRTPPPVDGSLSTAEVLRKLYPKDSGETVKLDGDADRWTDELVEVDAEIKKLEERKQAARNRLMAAIGTATFGVTPGGTRWSYKTTERNGHTVAPSSVRSLRRMAR
jgi:putative phage-type endonuclease